MDDDIYIKDCGSYFTVVNKNGDYSNHCHVENGKAANILKRQIKRQNVPKSDYFKSCALRVTVNQDYINKIERKIEKDRNRTQYININKGVKK